jgi:tRNA (adenine22-N1)-methyltransferase
LHGLLLQRCIPPALSPFFNLNLSNNIAKKQYAALGSRLECCAHYVRSGGVLLDVGTDHAMLPISLVLSGKINRAVASDINGGPVAAAERNVSRNGLSDKITVIKTDGLTGLEKFEPTDIVIAGMGGEMIISILSSKAAEWSKREGIRFILQPMTRQSLLRRFLAEDGYLTEYNSLAEDTGGRIYEIIVCRFTGEPYTISETEAIGGSINRDSPDELFIKHLAGKIKQLRRQAEGILKSSDNEIRRTELSAIMYTVEGLEELKKLINAEKGKSNAELL